MCNKKIRNDIKEMGFKHWQIAKVIGISPSTFCVWLRDELTGERLEHVQKAIEELSKEGTR